MRKFARMEMISMQEMQRADMWKRMSAALLDLILLAMVAVGMAYVMTTVLRYDSYEAEFKTIAAEHGVNLDLTSEELSEFTEEERAQYEAAADAFAKDEEANRIYALLFNLTLVIISVGVLLAYLLMEFAVPLMFGNGQTLGKKIFGIGVMRVDGIKLSPLLLFIRTVLGKFAVETMVPVYVFIMLIFSMVGIEGLIIVLGLLVLQIVLLVAGRNRMSIHDRLSHTVAVDFHSQRIFDSVEAREAYLERVRNESAASAD